MMAVLMFHHFTCSRRIKIQIHIMTRNCYALVLNEISDGSVNLRVQYQACLLISQRQMLICLEFVSGGERGNFSFLCVCVYFLI